MKKEQLINVLLELLTEEDPQPEVKEKKPEPQEMISFAEARQRSNLSRQALLGILNRDPACYIMNGRKYIINWGNLCLALKQGASRE